MMRNGENIEPLNIPHMHYTIPPVEYIDELDIDAQSLDD